MKDDLLQEASGVRTVVVVEDHVPLSFWRLRPGLQPSNDYVVNVATKAGRVPAGVAISFRTIEGSQGGQEDLRSPYFDETTVSALVATLIYGQPQGHEGLQVTDENFNYFPLEFAVVRTGWSYVGKCWKVSLTRRLGFLRLEGDRLFRPVGLRSDL